jgi:hypothetical protein
VQQDGKKNKYKQDCSGAYGGVWHSLRFARVWSQAAGFLLVHVAGICLQLP